MSDDGPGSREVARRLFAAEFDDASLAYSESDEERAPNYVVTPTGARVNRLFVAGVLTEVERVNDETSRGRVVDPSGAFVTYAGQYQPDAQAFLERATTPAFVALTGKARTFEPEDSDRVFTSVRPENLNEVDADTRDRWVVSAAEATLDRLAVFERALASDRRGADLRDALEAGGAPASLAAGIPKAIDHYDTSRAYVEALRRLAVDALELIAGERDEVRTPEFAPDGGGDADIGPLPATDVRIEPTGAADAADTTDEPAAADDVTATDGTERDDEPESAAEPTTADDQATADATGAPSAAGSASDETDAASSAVGAGDEGESASSDAGGRSTAGDDAFDVEDPDAGEVDGQELDTGEADSQEPDAGGLDDEPDGELGSFDAADGIDAAGAAADTDDSLGAFDDATGDNTDEQTTAADEMYEIDEAEREEIESEFGTDFSTGSDIGEPGEADIDVPDPEELSEGIDTGGGTADTPADPATDDPTPADPATSEDETADPATSEDETADAEAGANDDVDLEAAVVERMDSLDDGDGADRAAVVDAVTSEHGVDAAAVEDAIQDALMGGKCYEPGDGLLKAI
jgi:RPA family protein